MALARYKPSTKIFTVPSGKRNNCNTVATVPNRYKSANVGSSKDDFFCATKKIWLLCNMANSNALIERSRPTNKGNTIYGYTTTSRKGSTGYNCAGSTTNSAASFLGSSNIQINSYKTMIKFDDQMQISCFF